MLHNTDLNGYSTDIDPNDPMSALNTGSAVSITSVKSIRLFFMWTSLTNSKVVSDYSDWITLNQP